MSEQPARPDKEFLYVTYIRATPEQIWAGITEPEFTRQYWMHDNVSDWQEGSRWEHRQAGMPGGGEDGTVHIVGEVLESDRPNKLVVSWVPPADEGRPEKTSKVSFLLDQKGLEEWPHGPWTRLTVAHTEMDDEMHASVSHGWPSVLSGLKSVLELGGFSS